MQYVLRNALGWKIGGKVRGEAVSVMGPGEKIKVHLQERALGAPFTVSSQHHGRQCRGGYHPA